MTTFWHTQPVRLSTGAADPGAAEAGPREPPPGLSWCEIDARDGAALAEVREMLRRHYVEDAGQRFRLDYTPDFLRWALSAPGSDPSWLFGLRDGGGALVGLISAARQDLELDGEPRDAVAVNFLCVHPARRERGLAPLLIREVTRRVNARGIVSAIFTTSMALPVLPVARSRYHCRLLRPQRLVDLGYVDVPPRRSRASFAREHALPETAVAARPLTETDLPAAGELLERHLAGFRLRPRFSAEALRHTLLGSGVVLALAVPDRRGGLAAFFSVYRLDQRTPDGGRVRGAYWFYGAPGELSPAALLDAAAAAARRAECDVLYALDVSASPAVLADRLFLPTDGWLGYYLFNWSHDQLSAGEIAVLPL